MEEQDLAGHKRGVQGNPKTKGTMDPALGLMLTILYYFMGEKLEGVCKHMV